MGDHTGPAPVELAQNRNPLGPLRRAPVGGDKQLTLGYHRTNFTGRNEAVAVSFDPASDLRDRLGIRRPKALIHASPMIPRDQLGLCGSTGSYAPGGRAKPKRAQHDPPQSGSPKAAPCVLLHLYANSFPDVSTCPPIRRAASVRKKRRPEGLRCSYHIWLATIVLSLGHLQRLSPSTSKREERTTCRAPRTVSAACRWDQGAYLRNHAFSPCDVVDSKPATNTLPVLSVQIPLPRSFESAEPLWVFVHSVCPAGLYLRTQMSVV